MHSKFENDLVEKTLYEFESEWFKSQSVSIEDFLPASDHPNFNEILVELIRSHLELSGETSRPLLASDYFEKFPELEQDDDARKSIVFEEYRQAINRGEEISIEDFGIKYNVDFSSFQTGSQNQSSQSRAELKFPNVGEEIGGFKLIGLLGKGAYGRVYLAQQLQLENRLVVLKFTSNATDEHRLLARMQHTNIVPIHSIHVKDELQAICMPLLGVVTLSDLLRDPKGNSNSRISGALVQTITKNKEATVIESMDDDALAAKFLDRQNLVSKNENVSRFDSNGCQFAVELITKIADGLGYAHDRGIVHGDLKPANILLGDDGEPIILDFHLGRSITQNIGNLVGGTVPYMPAEQLLNFNDAFAKPAPTYDVYAAGVLLYELLTHQLPIAVEFGETNHDQIVQAKSKPFQVSNDTKSLIGEDLSSIIETCMSPNPSSRYQNGKELFADLQLFQKHQPLKIAGNGSFKNRVSKWAKRHPRLSSATFVSTIASILLIGLTVTLLLMNGRLAKIQAVEESNLRIKASQNLRPDLASAFDGTKDPSFFSTVSIRANELLTTNNWETEKDFLSIGDIGRLNEFELANERLKAAEIHFWIAEIYRKMPAVIAKNGESHSVAKRHNQIASEFWPAKKSKHALLIQAELLAGSARVSNNSKPDNPTDYLLAIYLADIPISEKEYEYEKLAKQHKDDFLVWMLLANSCISQNKNQEATAYYNVCRSIDPESILPLLYRGIELIRQGRVDEAIKDLQAADTLKPNDVTVLLNLGLALGKKRHFKEALEKYDRAIELGAHQTRAYLQRSQLKNAIGDKAGAKTDFDKFMSLEPVDEKSCIARGVRQLKTNPTAAIQSYERALQFNSQSSVALNDLANVHSEILNDNQTAIGYMTRALAINSKNPKFWASIAVLFAREGNEVKAIESAQTAIMLENSGDINYRIAGVFAQLSKKDEKYVVPAIAYLVQSALKDPAAVLRLNSNDPDIQPIAKSNEYEGVFSSISKLKGLLKKN